MKKLFELVRNQHHSIYRIFLFIIAIVITVYLMPRKKSFKYEAIEGKPWPHENFISDIEFSILKPLEQIAKEEKKVEDQKYISFHLKRKKRLLLNNS